jgi:hypothetical protein
MIMSLVLSLNSLKEGAYVHVQAPQSTYLVVKEVRADGVVFSGRSDVFLPLNVLQDCINARVIHAYSTKEELPPEFVARISSFELNTRLDSMLSGLSGQLEQQLSKLRRNH